MTRGWQFTLPNSGIAYNIWSLIQTQIVDPTFTQVTAPYMPKVVAYVRFYMNTASANTSNTISIIDAITGQEKRSISPGTNEFVDQMVSGNGINLDGYLAKPSANGCILDVSVTVQ